MFIGKYALDVKLKIGATVTYYDQTEECSTIFATYLLAHVGSQHLAHSALLSTHNHGSIQSMTIRITVLDTIEVTP
jgi:hypothetical protein